MDYQYPAENLDFDEIVEEQLELYKSASAKQLEELIPDQSELDVSPRKIRFNRVGDERNDG